MTYPTQISLTQPYLQTTLTLFDKSVTNLECKVNNELIKIEEWLKQNKLSLDCSKTCYMLINSHPSISCYSDLQLSLNDFTLKRQQIIKYLGIYIDENLKWSSHIHYLSLQTARYTGLFYRLSKFFMTLKRALNYFLNLTINREKFCL